ncbi:hypothetical protein LINPERHAP1_LOCUS27654, partial [Linum perenne]
QFRGERKHTRFFCNSLLFSDEPDTFGGEDGALEKRLSED